MKTLIAILFIVLLCPVTLFAGPKDTLVAQLDLPPLPDDDTYEDEEFEDPLDLPVQSDNQYNEDEYFEEDDYAEPAPAKESPVPVREPLDEDSPSANRSVPKKITLDAVVYVDYQFFESPDAFKIKYHINMGGNANLATALITGNAEIATEVTGFLAKWGSGQCILDVSVSKTPYEIAYNSAADEADISVKFKNPITEKWESTCSFMGAPAKPFKTEGTSEKWISDALEKTTPPLSAIAAPLEAGGSSSLNFTIPEYTVIEEGLGSAQVKGTGIITIQPVKKTIPKPTSKNFSPPKPHSRQRVLVKRTGN